MAEQISSLVDLPLDVLVLVFPYLDAKSFLSLCSTCKAFQQPSIRLDSAYWSNATRSTFRVPNQPVVQSDGLRWQKMYRRLLTQSRVFTWGQNTNHCLGHSYQQHDVNLRRGTRGMQLRGFGRTVNTNVSFPTEMDHSRELGIIADMQCGGWSTALLTSKGSLYITGIMDGLGILHDTSSNKLDLLKYPPGFPQSVERYEPSVATRQFSSGRSHLLALSDSGRIWSWYAIHLPALHVKFLHVDIIETSSASCNQAPAADATGHMGRVRQVVAGWAHSSAYIYGTGIILWSPVKRPRSDNDSDMMLVVESAVVPKTSYQRTKNAFRQSEEDKALGVEVGMVTNYIILEHFVVLVTDIGKVFAAKIGAGSTTADIMELRRLRNDTGTPLDVQGSFHQFAIFKNDEVFTSNEEYLDRCWEVRFENLDHAGIQGLQLIPALQHNDVISVAFGDYHYHALHSNGRITSYGKDPQGCGALGLGSQNKTEAMIRGIEVAGLRGEGQLLPQTYTTGRQIWFEKEKRDWMLFMATGGKDPEEARERMLISSRDHEMMGEVSEWFEQESRDWDKRPELKDADEDGLGAYFALSVSAAGWHSGALVLVNETLAQKLYESCVHDDTHKVAEKLRDSSVGEGAEESSSPPGKSNTSLSLMTSVTRCLTRAGRQFLGLPPCADLNGSAEAIQPTDRNSERPGTLTSDGLKYSWADDSWPRLRLSDGREMPGDVSFSEWRFGRPSFKLDFEA